MENNNNNYTYSSYPDSNTSTPRSREVDCETTYDEPNPNPNPNYKVKLMCSYGGKILPRPHDNQLTYIGGDTKILTVDRNIRYNSILHKLTTLSSSPDSDHICFKYQLPGEDLDALISVTNDEDLEHMMSEYDRIYRSSVKPVRLRLFMFPLSPVAFGGGGGVVGGGDSKTEQQWFVDALNAVQISSSSASQVSENPDFLFGFDKGNAAVTAAAAVAVQPMESVRPGSECGSEDSNSNSNSTVNNNNNNNNMNMSNRNVVNENVVSPALEMQKQQMQINMDPRAYYGDYYTKIQAAGPTAQPRYWQEQRHMTTGGYPMSVAGTDSPVYLIPSSTGVYPSAAAPVPAPAVATLRPAPQANQGQAYYGMQRMVNPTEFYREQPVYGTMTQPQIQQPKVGGYQETIGMVRPQAELGYGHVGQLGPVGVDATGRQVYYTNSQGGMGPTYQPVVAAAADMRQGPGLTVNQEGKMVVNPNKIP